VCAASSAGTLPLFISHSRCVLLLLLLSLLVDRRKKCQAAIRALWPRPHLLPSSLAFVVYSLVFGVGRGHEEMGKGSVCVDGARWWSREGKARQGADPRLRAVGMVVSSFLSSCSLSLLVMLVA
jgi:hypothetical protein